MAAKTAETTQTNSVTVMFALEKETANALRYQECNEAGEKVERAFAKIGTQYVPKVTLGQGVKPERITAVFTW